MRTWLQIRCCRTTTSNTISHIMNIQYCSKSNLIAIYIIDFCMFIFVNHLNDYTTTYICLNVTTKMIGINQIPSFISNYLNMGVLFHNLYIHACMICCSYGSCQLCVLKINILIDLTSFPYEYTVYLYLNYVLFLIVDYFTFIVEHY